MTFNDTVDIIYDYIILGHSMQTIADDFNCSASEISSIICGYNFNKVKQKSYQRGQDNGRYRKGSPACRGVNIDWNFIADFVDAYDNNECWCFEEFLDGFALNYEEERRYQAQLEAQRAKEAEIRQREAEAAAARARQLEQERLAAQRAEAARQGQYNEYYNNALSYMKSGNYTSAIKCLKNAKQINYNTQICALLSECMAKSGNISMYAREIITELTAYMNTGMALSESQHITLAEAYLLTGDKGRACDHWFYAGDIYYDRENYKEADRLYTLARTKTNYYSSSSVEAPFRVAYARANAGEYNRENWEFVLHWYMIAVKAGCSSSIAYSNASFYARLLGKFSDAEDYAKKAISGGFKRRNSCYNLLLAQMCLKKYTDALSTIETMDRNGFDYEIWRKGKCIIESKTGDFSLAIYCFKEFLNKDPFHRESLAMLSQFVEDKSEAYKYAMKYLRSINKNTVPAEYEYIAEKALNYARLLGDKAKIQEALFYNEDEKRRLEEEKRIKEAQLKARFERLIAEGKKLISEGKYNDAVSVFKEAKKLSLSDSLLSGMAEAMAKCDNKSFYAGDIISALSQYEKSGARLSSSQHIYLAEAYFSANNKNAACDEWFNAGNIFYSEKNYGEADRLYTLALEKTNMYSGKSPDVPFNIAYARSKGRVLSEENSLYCIKWYLKSAEKKYFEKESYFNASFHSYRLKNYPYAEAYAEKAISLGFENEKIYNILLHSQMKLEEYSLALKTIKKMEEKHYQYEIWRKGKCILVTKEEDASVAVKCFKEFLQKNPFHREALTGLISTDTNKEDLFSYAMTLLKNDEGKDVSSFYSYSSVASLALKTARELNDSHKINEALYFNPEEKRKIDEQIKRQQEEEERKRQEEQLLLLI